MKINAFFASRLNTPLANHLWSWGAYNQTTNQVFLRNGRWSVDEYDDGKQWMIVYNPAWPASAGHSERLRHLEMIKGGTEGLVVLVEFSNSDHIASFDDQTLLRIGNITEEGGLIYAEVLGKSDVEDALKNKLAQSAIDDIAAIKNSASETTRRALVDARLGQGKFRSDVLRIWDYGCAVTGVCLSAAIRASHIKPWRESNNRERLDPCNGLPLLATLDCLFDNGYIAFDRSHRIVLSTLIPAVDRGRLSLDGLRLCKRPPKETALYLRDHRERVFRP